MSAGGGGGGTSGNSKGRYFNKAIKNNYAHRRLG